jgi:hypothetical protein
VNKIVYQIVTLDIQTWLQRVNQSMFCDNCNAAQRNMEVIEAQIKHCCRQWHTD